MTRKLQSIMRKGIFWVAPKPLLLLFFLFCGTGFALGLLWRQFSLIGNFPLLLRLRATPSVRAVYAFCARVFSYVFFFLLYCTVLFSLISLLTGTNLVIKKGRR